MIGNETSFLIAGIFIGALVVAVFDGVRFWDLHMINKAAKSLIIIQEEMIEHLEQLVHPAFNWDDEPSLKIKGRIYDKYPELVKPGTEVIRIDNEEVTE